MSSTFGKVAVMFGGTSGRTRSFIKIWTGSL